jgi:hypothetical protein
MLEEIGDVPEQKDENFDRPIECERLSDHLLPQLKDQQLFRGFALGEEVCNYDDQLPIRVHERRRAHVCLPHVAV